MIEQPGLRQAMSALGELQDVMLTAMWEAARAECLGFGLRFFEPLPREVARGVLRDLRDRGLVQHVKGLWDEDGMPRGAGYALTEKAVLEFKKMEQEDDG